MVDENKVRIMAREKGVERVESSAIMLDSMSMKCTLTCMLTKLPKHAYMVSL